MSVHEQIVSSDTPDPADTPELPAEGLSVDQLEAAMAAFPQRPIEPVHRFADGLYAREITIPAGTLLTGKIHRTRHLNIVSKGEISVWTEGEPVRRIRAPFSFVAEPGTRRVGYAHEETVWTTVHATRETDLERLEAELIEPHENPLLPPNPERLCRG